MSGQGAMGSRGGGGSGSTRPPDHNIGERVRVFIGTEPRTEIARKVLEVSIRRRTDADVTVVPMIGPDWEYPTYDMQFGTGFSLRRWMIAAACDFKGRAIYMDADQLVLGDVLDLWRMPDRYPLAGASVWCTHQPDAVDPKACWPLTSVMVIDCAAARSEWGWKIGLVLDYLKANPSRAAYHDFMHAIAPNAAGVRTWWPKTAPVRIPDEWNALDRYEHGKTKLLHYTSEPNQPWYNPDHPNAGVWQTELMVAVDRNAVTMKEIEDAVGRFAVGAHRRASGLHPFYGQLHGKNNSRKPKADGTVRPRKSAGRPFLPPAP